MPQPRAPDRKLPVGHRRVPEPHQGPAERVPEEGALQRDLARVPHPGQRHVPRPDLQQRAAAAVAAARDDCVQLREPCDPAVWAHPGAGERVWHWVHCQAGRDRLHADQPVPAGRPAAVDAGLGAEPAGLAVEGAALPLQGAVARPRARQQAQDPAGQPPQQAPQVHCQRQQLYPGRRHSGWVRLL